MGAFPRLDGHVEMAGRIGHLAKQRQIGGGQGADDVRLHEEVECLLPGSPRCRVTRPLDDATTGSIAHRTLPQSMTDRSPGLPAPNVTVRVTAVPVLLTPWGCVSRLDARNKGDGCPVRQRQTDQGVFTPEQKQEIIAKVTDTMVGIEGESMRQVTWVTVDEVESGDWAWAATVSPPRM